MYCCVYACAQARAHTFASDWHREIIWTPTDQPMERGAHTVASERARWTSQTVAPTAWRTHTHCRQIQASIQHAWMPAIRLSITASSPPPLHSLRCSRRMCAQGPPTVSYWAEGWQDGDYGWGELERWVPQPVRRRLWAAGTLLSPQIVSLQLVHRGLLTGSSTSALL